MRHGGFVQVAEFLEKSLRLQFLVSSLVIGNDFVRLYFPLLHRHAVGHVLRIEIFPVADVATQEQFRTGIHHLIHVRGAGRPSFLPFVVRTVVEVYLRTVRIPKRVRHGWQDSVEGRHILVLELPFAVHRRIPPDHDRRIVQVIVHRGRALDGLQSTQGSLAVVLLEELHICIDREPAPPKLQQQGTFGLTDASGCTVAQVTAHQHHVSLALVGIELFPEPGRILRQSMTGDFAQPFAADLYAAPSFRPAGETSLGVFHIACLLRAHHLVHHLGVQNVFQLTCRFDTRLVLLVEPYRLGIETYLAADILFLFTLFHFLVCVFVCLIVCCTDAFRHGSVGYQRLPSVPSALNDSQSSFTGVLVVSGLTDNTTTDQFRKADADCVSVHFHDCLF